MNKKLTFQPFDPHQAVKIYKNGLPHWRQEGAIYFVTFRLADSIPANILSAWEDDKRKWLRANHGVEMEDLERLPRDVRRAFEKEFGRQLNEYLGEGRGECVFRRIECAQVVLERVIAFHGQRHDLGDLVIMPNHVHFLITPYPGHKLEMIMKGIKGTSAREINRKLGRKGKLWLKDSYDHIVRTSTHLRKYQEYIKANPDKARLPKDSCILRSVEYET